MGEKTTAGTDTIGNDDDEVSGSASTTSEDFSSISTVSVTDVGGSGCEVLLSNEAATSSFARGEDLDWTTTTSSCTTGYFSFSTTSLEVFFFP